MTNQLKSELESQIIKIESEITIAIINGHRPYHGDIFEDKRNELNTLRCIVYGYGSKFCKIKKGS
jgi:hypothetical protein